MLEGDIIGLQTPEAYLGVSDFTNESSTLSSNICVWPNSSITNSNISASDSSVELYRSSKKNNNMMI